MTETSLSSLLRQAAQAAAGGQRLDAGTLYVVATPIGNLADMSLRAIQVLAQMDVIACEDTRHTQALTRHLGLDVPLWAVHAHNERAAAQRVIARLREGARVGFVSDAGTPAVSDPGARLVDAVVQAGLRVCPIPGPSAVVTALSASGAVAHGDAHGYVFHGFLPAQGQARTQALTALCEAPLVQVLFESPLRLADLLASLATLAPERRVTVCRELTKQFEDIVTDVAAALPPWWERHPARGKGECVVVLHAQAQTQDVLAAARPALDLLLAELPLARAVALAARITGAPRKALYADALARRDERDAAGEDTATD